ncbi:hypothetical protein ACM66B_001311 [Microbotryomycetes sp. NB124-2]
MRGLSWQIALCAIISFLPFAPFATVFVKAEGDIRKIHVVNACKQTLWMAIFTASLFSVGPQVEHKTGWESPSGSKLTFEVPESWGGRVWARTGCDFSKNVPDHMKCETGGCNGGLECARGGAEGGTGVIPVTLAEFNLQKDIDHYDTTDCPLSNCPFDLLTTCPEQLKYKNEKGETVGCLTDCGATNKPEYCCAGAHDKPETCPASAIPNYKWWKDSCPIAYAYAYDESSGTALFTCKKRVDYTITFCPSDDLYEDFAVLPDGSTVSQGTGKPAPTVAVTKDLTSGSGGGGGGDQAQQKPKENLEQPGKQETKDEPKKEGGGGDGNKTTDAPPKPTDKPEGGDKKDEDKENDDKKPSPTGGNGTAGNSPKETGGTSSSSSNSNGSPGSGPGSVEEESTPDDSSSSSSTTTDVVDDGTILGMPQNWAIGLIVGVVVLLIIVIGASMYACNRSRSHDKVATSEEGQSGASSFKKEF